MCALIRLHAEAEFVTGDRVSQGAGRRPSPRQMGLFETIGIEHLFKAGHRSVVQVVTAIPHTLERGDLVVAGAFACLERKSGIRADRDSQNVERRRRIRWWIKPCASVSLLLVYNGGV